MPRAKNFFQFVSIFFDKKEDSVRAYLSKRPILYALVAGVSVVLFWRGVWMTADLFPFLSGPVSILISTISLLLSGVFVSYFVGDIIILSGIAKEKKVIDKTAEEIIKEGKAINRIEDKIDDLEKKVDAFLKENKNRLDFHNK